MLLVKKKKISLKKGFQKIEDSIRKFPKKLKMLWKGFQKIEDSKPLIAHDDFAENKLFGFGIMCSDEPCNFQSCWSLHGNNIFAFLQ